MVGSLKLKALFTFLLFCLFGSLGNNFAGEPELSLRVEEENAYEGRSLRILLTLSRDQGVDFDIDSFLLNGQPFNPIFSHDTQQSTISVVNGDRKEEHRLNSVFHFDLPPQKPGAYVLGPASVEVGGEEIISPVISYEIFPLSTSDDLRLEAFVLGPKEIYPGQETVLAYRIYFNGNIELLHQELPLIDAHGLERVGPKEVKHLEGKGFQEIFQTVRGKEPGLFRLGPSRIEGKPFRQDFFGRRNYSRRLLRSEAEPVSVLVKQFPPQKQPPSFNGLLGRVTLKGDLLSSSELCVGDKLELRLTLEGEKPSSICLPDLSRQAALSQGFRFSDIPPVGKEYPAGKTFDIELRPLSPDIPEIPPIEVSYFDPDSRLYHRVRTDPIPITVKPLPMATLPVAVSPEVRKNDKVKLQTGEADIQLDSEGLDPILIFGLKPLTAKALKADQVPWNTFWIPIILCVGLVLETVLANFLFKKKIDAEESAKELMRQAEEAVKDRELLSTLVHRALLRRLLERGYIGKRVQDAQELPFHALQGEIRRFLIEIEEDRFSGIGLMDEERLLKRARELFDKI